MKSSSRETVYQVSLEDTLAKSPIARTFWESRSAANSAVEKADNKLLKRLYNLDHNTYLEGALDAKTKELMGLVASASLRCDDCINYHIIQAYRIGANKLEIEESLMVATVVGGTIVVPHLRRAYLLLEELFA